MAHQIDSGADKKVPVIIPATPDQAGCWIESRWGSYANERLMTIARCYGWQPGNELESDLFVLKFSDEFSEELAGECAERVDQAVEGLVAWMNENVAPENYTFRWIDGEFYLMRDRIVITIPAQGERVPSLDTVS